MSLRDFSDAAYRTTNDQAPIRLTARHRWRERGTRLIRFLTNRSFRGDKWHSYKNQQLNEQFVRSLQNQITNEPTNHTIKTLFDMLKAKGTSLTRHDVLFSIKQVTDQVDEDKTVALLKGGYTNPTHQYYENKERADT